MHDTTDSHASTPRTAQRLRVLVVEDNPDMLATTVELVQALGHWATGLKSAELALHRFLEGAFDVLIADIGLPGLSGQDLAEKLQRRSPLPVIFATGQGPPDHPPAHSIWLRKPYSIAQLEEALTQAALLGKDLP